MFDQDGISFHVLEV